jgi:hypothetical protein
MGSILGSDASEWVIQLFLAWLRDREGAVYMLVGFLFPGLVGINDMLNDLEVIRTAFLIHIGMFVFILFQAVDQDPRAVCASLSGLVAWLSESSGVTMSFCQKTHCEPRSLFHDPGGLRGSIAHAPVC